MRNFPRCLITVTLTLLTPAAFASDFQSPRTAALGGAGHAAPLLTDSIYLNPSYASFLPSYIVSANYGIYHGNQQPDGTYATHGRIANVAVQDGENPLFQAGVGATLKEDMREVNVGASKALMKQLGIGVGAKFLFPNSGNGANTNDAIASMTFVAANWIQGVLVVDNIVDSSAMQAQNLYREFTVGTKFTIQNLAFIYFDPHLAPNIPSQPSFGHETGLELTPFEDLFIRFGMFRNANIPELQNARGRGYGMGIGLVAPKISLDYGYKHVVNPINDGTHNFGVSIYF